MANLTDIKYRMKGIAQTRQITNAMETISVAKMRKALQNYEANQIFFDRIRTTIKDIVLHSKDVTHKYLNKAGGDRAVYVVIASDKGLAGAYNSNILNLAWEHMSNRSERYVFTVGHMAREFFEHHKISIEGEFLHVTLNPTVRDAAAIVSSLLQLYEMDLMDEVYIAYTSMINSSQVKPVIMKLLPLRQDEVIANLESTERDEEYYKELYYEPSPDIVLANLVPQYLTGVIYGCLVQSVASEHSSRMLAMSNATKNASEILERLTLTYNRARQESITKELTEIITSSGNFN